MDGNTSAAQILKGFPIHGPVRLYYYSALSLFQYGRKGRIDCKPPSRCYHYLFFICIISMLLFQVLRKGMGKFRYTPGSSIMGFERSKSRVAGIYDPLRGMETRFTNIQPVQLSTRPLKVHSNGGHGHRAHPLLIYRT